MRTWTVCCLSSLLPAMAGCVVLETLEGVDLLIEPQTGAEYYLYVPTTY